MHHPLSRVAAVAALVLLSACETTPSVGATATAQVIAIPRSRADLPGSYGEVHAAVRAGVTRSSAERGRLVLGQCAERDPTAHRGVRWRSVTTVLPEGVAATRGTLVEIDQLVASPSDEGRHHGRFVAAGGTLDPAHAIPSSVSDEPGTVCRPGGLPGGRMRVRLHSPVPADAYDFGAAELRRQQQFSDAELAAGRVVTLACQLKVVDGSDWYKAGWIARMPEGLDLQVGDAVRVRAGAEDASKDVEPMTQVLALDATAAARRNAVVRCR